MSTIIVVLGSPNDAQGRLYSLAVDRCRLAAKLARDNPDAKLLLTGGFGSHFNTTALPHAEYVRRHLCELGLDASRFLPHALSRNTIEDATLSSPIVEEYGGSLLLVVTSDFHVPRARFLFEREYAKAGVSVAFVAADTDDRTCELDLVQLKAHEERSLGRLRQQAV